MPPPKEKTGAAAPPAKTVTPITCAYEELLRQESHVLSAVEKAYGPGGLGIIAVSGVPGLQPARARLLPLAQRLATALTDGQRRELEDPESRFNFGWSHGKEFLSDGRADDRKGSFYANPLLPEGKESPLDKGGATAAAAGGGEGEGEGEDERRAPLARFPGVCRPNVWPRDPAVLPELRPAFRELGRILADVAVAVAGACDAMLLAAKRRREAGAVEAEEAGTETQGEGEGGGLNGGGNAREAAATQNKTAAPTLRSLIESGDAAKGRLLYYYPPGRRSSSLCGGGGGGEEGGGGEGGEEGGGGGGGGGAAAAAAAAAAAPSASGEQRDEEEEEQEEEDSWCGWHVDSGALTALVRAMFLDPRGSEVEAPGGGAGGGAGLYVRPRRGWRPRRRSSSSTCGGGGEIERGPSADGGDGEREEQAPAVRVSIPEGCVAVQAGEAAQVFSGGAIVATPHCVRGVGGGGAGKRETSSGQGEEEGISRATFALFMQPRWDAPLEPSCVVAGGGAEKEGGGLHSPESVGVARWRPGDTFGDFTERTFSAYYK